MWWCSWQHLLQAFMLAMLEISWVKLLNPVMGPCHEVGPVGHPAPPAARTSHIIRRDQAQWRTCIPVKTAWWSNSMLKECMKWNSMSFAEMYVCASSRNQSQEHLPRKLLSARLLVPAVLQSSMQLHVPWHCKTDCRRFLVSPRYGRAACIYIYI